MLTRLRASFGATESAAAVGWRPGLWLIAVVIGMAVAYATIGLRIAIAGVQWGAYGTPDERWSDVIGALPVWWLVLMPALGGLAVGGLLMIGRNTGLLPEGRSEGVADVMEAQAGREADLPLRRGLMSALIAAVSLGAGASAGREGPAVHLGATLGSFVAKRLGFPANVGRILLACGVAAAVSASFNAPIAGVLFALEVVLGHYALSVFAPIVIASVSAAVVTRLNLNEFPAFVVPETDFNSYLQLPAFVLLGLVCGIVAVIFMRTVVLATDLHDHLTKRWQIPLWSRPVIGGLMVGAIAVFFPQVLGVGYEATDAALNGSLAIGLLIALVIAKTAATAITLACRFGGGVFSPALYLGAMTGGAFGIVAGGVFPDLAASPNFYAMVGMGAVAAAILGAPISTTLIAFELVRQYEVAIALMVAVSIATVLTQAAAGKSFFHWQIERRGLKLREGPQHMLLRTITVRDVMQAATQSDLPQDDLPLVSPMDRLDTVFGIMDTHMIDVLAVAEPGEDKAIVGLVRRSDALAVFNRALIQAHVESRR